MSERPTGTKRAHVDSDPDVYEGSEDDLNDSKDVFDEVLSSKRSKREKGIGGGLQVYTQYVCEKLEKEKQMLNTDLADMLVKEHNTGDSKKNDNIRRRVYDALSVIDAVGLATKEGKIFKWLGRPSIAHSDNSDRIKSNLSNTLSQKRQSLIQLIKRAVGLEYLYTLRRGRSALSMDGSHGNLLSIKQHVDEIGEFPLPLLVLSTDASTRMVMETDANNSEVYLKLTKPYQLKSSDSVLTELGYDDINKLDKATANALIQMFIQSRIPKDIIEEALAITIPEETFQSLLQASQPSDMRVFHSSRDRGMDAIMKAARMLDSGKWGTTGEGLRSPTTTIATPSAK